MCLEHTITARTKTVKRHTSPRSAPIALNGLPDPPFPRYPINKILAKQNAKPIEALSMGNSNPETNMKINIGAIYSTRF